MLVRTRRAPLVLLAVLLATSLLSFAVKPLPVASSETPSARLQTPENLSTDGSPFDVALGGGYVFWTHLLGEFCGPPGSLRSLNLATRVQATLVSDCGISLANVVADDSHVYYAGWISDTVKRIPVGGGTPATVASASGLIYHRALAVDATYTYFGDDVGVRRVPKGGGTVITLAAGYDSYKLAVDSTYVYWTEWTLVGNDAIRRVPKAGGAVQTILLGGTLADPLGIAVDGSYVYWTERDSGKVRRVAKTGGTILDLVPTQVNYLADSIAVDGEHVYWADTTGTPGTARLRRVPKNGGAVENLVLGRSGLHGINLLANYVYWGDWDGVWRLQVGPFEVHLPLIARQYQD